MLKRLQDAGLKVNREKCEFYRDRVQICGHEMDRGGLHKTQEKIEAVVSTPRPENVSQLRSFLGFPNAFTVLHPLHQLLEQAFTEAKRIITSELVLTHYDQALLVRLACDASPTVIGSVLLHVMPGGSEGPVAFASRWLTKTERKYAQIDKEEGVPAMTSVRLQRYALFLAGFGYEIEYKSTTEHLINDLT